MIAEQLDTKYFQRRSNACVEGNTQDGSPPGDSAVSCRCILSYLAYLSPVPITIELPDLASQTGFNLARWSEILADSQLAELPYRIETDQYGHLVMSPPPAPLHGQRQVDVALLLRQLLPAGRILSECPVSTAAGVKAIDVAWLAPGRTENIPRLTLFERAPDICVEILSPSNSAAEIQQKRVLYFDAGAAEVWICNLDGSMSYYVAPRDQQTSTSILCPTFPDRIP
jgi:Uma2 family endonuclease